MTKSTDKVFEFSPKEIPTDSGCYLFYDKNKELLYVGKAKNLKKRVSQYFQKNDKNLKTKLMVSKIMQIETQIVNSEMEALILENNLIKEHKPRFNILLRDDKNFTYLRVTNEEEPKLEIVRRVIKDGSTYFGPKTSAKEFRVTVKFCQKFFGAKMVKPNQDYYINILTGKETPIDEYRQNIERMKKFLRGSTDEVVKELTEKMMHFATEKNFEAAAKTRDTLQSINKSTQKQSVEFTDLIDRDFINYYQDTKTIYVVRMVFRQGKFRDLNRITFKGADFHDATEIITNFLTQFYEKVVDPPREIYIPEAIEEAAILANFLSEKFFKGQKIDLLVPQKGNKKTIIELAAKNAKNDANKSRIEALSQTENFSKALPELAKALNLKEPPKRMECYDISHFSGTHTVASMVVFENGKPKSSEYRRFKIKQLDPGKIDDFASMEEVLSRRFGRVSESGFQDTQDDKKSSDSNLQMKPVETEEEWKIYHDIIRTEIFVRYYDAEKYRPDHPDLKKKNFQAFLCYKDKKAIGAFLFRRLTKTRGQIALLAVKNKHQKQNIGTQVVTWIQAFALENGQSSLVLNANPESTDFYKKIDFESDFWKGNSDDKNNIPLGKKLIKQKEKWTLPDLIVIDGGKGQLSSVMKVFKDLAIDNFDPKTQIIALAKREEQIFRPGIKEPLELDFENSALKLLQRIRDEAHRFAISFNRSLRQKNQTKSILDEITGIGGTTKKKLMQEFETVSGVRDASDKDLLKVVNKKQLQSLRRQL